MRIVGGWSMIVATGFALLGCAEVRPPDCPHSLRLSQCEEQERVGEPVPDDLGVVRRTARSYYERVTGAQVHTDGQPHFFDVVPCFEDVLGAWGQCVMSYSVVSRLNWDGPCHMFIIRDHYPEAYIHELFHCWDYERRLFADYEHERDHWGLEHDVVEEVMAR